MFSVRFPHLTRFLSVCVRRALVILYLCSQCRWSSQWPRGDVITSRLPLASIFWASDVSTVKDSSISIISIIIISSKYPKARLTRQEQTLYNRLRIGHTYLTLYLLKDEDPPICIPCNSLWTVEHILISCIDFDIIRQNFYPVSNLKGLLHNIHPKRIISFVHAIGLTNKL